MPAQLLAAAPARRHMTPWELYRSPIPESIAVKDRAHLRAAWDKAAAAFRETVGCPGVVIMGGARTRAFDLGCEWQAMAFAAGLGRVDRPSATAYPVEQEGGR